MMIAALALVLTHGRAASPPPSAALVESHVSAPALVESARASSGAVVLATPAPGAHCVAQAVRVDSIGGTVETPSLKLGEHELDCPKPEFKGFLKVNCLENGDTTVVVQTCAWNSFFDIVMNLQPKMVPPRALTKMAQEAGRELARVLEASRLATQELNYVRTKKEQLAAQCTSDAEARNRTMIRMHDTDTAAVRLDEQEEVAKSELVEANREIALRSDVLNKTRETLQDVKDQRPLNSTAINKARENVHHAEDSLKNAEDRFFSYLQQLRTINNAEFAAQQQYAQDYRQLLEFTNEYKADLAEYEAVYKAYEKYDQRDKDLKADAVKQKQLHEKLQELAQVDRTETQGNV